MKFTKQQYTYFQTAFDHFNLRLFSGKLPQVLITLQRKRGAAGFYSSNKFSERGGEHVIDEIALNPDCIWGYEDVELWQTLVHEMCHQWQFVYGKVSRSGYHNKEWADKMESIGLMPSSTGAEGGNKTGQSISDYPIPNGIFLREVSNLKKEGVYVKWESVRVAKDYSESLDLSYINLVNELSRCEDEEEKNTIEQRLALVAAERIKENQIKAKIRSKMKYSCSSCGLVVRGKQDLAIACLDCDETLVNDESIN